MCIRDSLGTGRQDFPVRLKLPEERKVFVKDSMEEEAEALWKRFQYLEEVPVGEMCIRDSNYCQPESWKQ